MSTTNKRYKQPSENNHRFQDIPPRFKRQKSLNSQKVLAAMDSADQNSNPSQKNKKPLGDSSQSNGLTTMAQRFQIPREGRKIVKKLPTQKAQQYAEKNLLKPQTTEPFVLSPMENRLFSLVRNDEYENPQFSATQNHNYPSSCSPYPQPAAPLCDSFTNNASIHPQVTVPNQQDPYGWVERNQSFNSPEQRVSPSPSVSSHRSASNQSPNTSYSDPDIRTIEMLRELERVADQTDVGSEESSNDKNSLVSHHLRMLMCAVDRYTQGVEDDEGNNSCEEEISPQKTPQVSSPNSGHLPPQVPYCHIPSPPQIQIKDLSHNQEFSDTDSAFSEEYCSPTKSIDQFSAAANHRMFNTWNPWATPSFNALDVYAVTPPNANHNNNVYYSSHPSMFMSDYHNMYNARDSF